MNLNEMKNNLVKTLGLEFLSEGQQNTLIGQIGEVLQKRIMLRVVDAMDEGIKEEFDNLLASVEGQPDAEEKVSAFLSEKIPNMQMLVDEEVEKVKEEVKQDVEAVHVVA